MWKAKVALVALILSATLAVLDGTLSKADKDTKKQKQKKSSSEKSADPGMTYAEILQSHGRVDYREEKKFPNEVLAYVTPWNNHGYDAAKFLAQKFSLVSPVWLQIHPSLDSDPPTCTVAGAHDNDQGWVRDVRANNSNVRIVPRLLFERWSGQDLRHLFAYEDEQIRCADEVISFLKRNQFEGAVVEIWVAVMTMSQGLAANELIHFIINWAELFDQKHLEFILPVPPTLDARLQESPLFTAEHFSQLLPFVDYFNIMTYDFPDRKAGAVAPIDWVRKCLEVLLTRHPEGKEKILMGLNFYGYDYSPMGSKVDAVVGNRYLEILRMHKPELSWHRTAAEHSVEYKGHVLYYPSLVSVEARLNLAKELGVGVGIWEIGQGLDYFFNLF